MLLRDADGPAAFRGSTVRHLASVEGRADWSGPAKVRLAARCLEKEPEEAPAAIGIGAAAERGAGVGVAHGDPSHGSRGGVLVIALAGACGLVARDPAVGINHVTQRGPRARRRARARNARVA